MEHFDLERAWPTLEEDLQDYPPKLTEDLRRFRVKTMALPSALWTMGYQVNTSNMDAIHNNTVLKMGIYRWCVLSREAKRQNIDPDQLWREARENGLGNLKSWKRKKGGGGLKGGDSAKLTNGVMSGVSSLGVARVNDYGGEAPYWQQAGIVDSEATFHSLFKEANRKEKCANCELPGHSVAWCQADRQPTLLCQLCMCGAHHERLCDSSDMTIPGNSPPPIMWGVNVRMWMGRISNLRTFPAKGVGK